MPSLPRLMGPAVTFYEAGRWNEVIVKEPHQPIGGGPQAHVACRSAAVVGLPMHVHGHGPGFGLDRLLRAVGGAIEHHHDRKVLPQLEVRRQLLVEGSEEAEQWLPALVRGDGDRHSRPHSTSRYVLWQDCEP